MRKFNHTMALKWMIYLPLLLPVCIIFGALEGMFNAVVRIIKQISLDLRIQANSNF
ncbi:hypothetical protein [Dyadobacter sp. CY323]|uniref:hypothetical protein n=1 Tax=Dyadobacter sp. CY323 TaxID=2907302 RepID=UPI001F44C814|nr:hypothetical protein [Dyadobacter sp. CY323]MCE6992711.1 hypothetical protein [Dyadobacter sp. CY323]